MIWEDLHDIFQELHLPQQLLSNVVVNVSIVKMHFHYDLHGIGRQVFRRFLNLVYSLLDIVVIFFPEGNHQFQAITHLLLVMICHKILAIACVVR